MVFVASEVPIYMCHILFVGDCDADRATDVIYRYKNKHIRVEFDNNLLGCCVGSGGDVFVWVKDLERGSVVIHELYHAAVMVMRNKGIPISEDTEEVTAYLLGWMKKKIMDKVYEKRNSKLIS
jgi:hypothetical protein